MEKLKNDMPQIAEEHQPAVALIAAGVLVLLFTTGIFGELLGFVFGTIGMIFGFIGSMIGLVFGFVGGLIGVIFGTLGGFLGLFFGSMIIWLPALLIIGGLMTLSRNSRGEKVKNDTL